MVASLRRLAALVIVALAALSSLATLPTPPPPAWVYESALPLVVGIGAGPLAVYEEGDPVPLELGFQGGQHVNVVLRATGVSEGEEANAVAWIVSADDVDTVLVEPVASEVAFYPDSDDSQPGDPLLAYTQNVFVEEPDAILGIEVELRVQLTFADGRVARAWHRGVAEWLPEGYRESLWQDAGPPGDAGR